MILQARNLASENPQLITKWIDSGSNHLGNAKGWTAAKWADFKTGTINKWTTFKAKFPGTAGALRGIGRVTSAPFRGIYRFYQNHKVAIGRAAKGGLVIFTIGMTQSLQ